MAAPRASTLLPGMEFLPPPDTEAGTGPLQHPPGDVQANGIAATSPLTVLANFTLAADASSVLVVENLSAQIQVDDRRVLLTGGSAVVQPTGLITGTPSWQIPLAFSVANSGFGPATAGITGLGMTAFRSVIPMGKLVTAAGAYVVRVTMLFWNSDAAGHNVNTTVDLWFRLIRGYTNQ